MTRISDLHRAGMPDGVSQRASGPPAPLRRGVLGLERRLRNALSWRASRSVAPLNAIFASWNQRNEWLRQIDRLSEAADGRNQEDEVSLGRALSRLGRRDLTICRKWRRANSRPEPVFKYRSKARAGASSSNSRTTSVLQGRCGAVWVESPLLWASSRRPTSDVTPT